MEFRYWLTVFYLFNLVDFVWTSRCSNPPECKLGVVSQECKCVPCPPAKYRVVRSGRPRCEFCTQQCSADRHLVQIKDCTVNSNRECYCDRGYFCEIAAQYTCRRCHSCPDGTFMDTTSRRSSCKKHTDCVRLGMALTSKGNRTHDQVCAHITPSPTHRDLSTPNDLLGFQNAMELNSVVKGTTVRLPTVSTKTFAPEIETAAIMWDAQTATHHISKRTLMGAGSDTPPYGQSSHNFQFWPLIMLFGILVLLLGFGKIYKNMTPKKKCLPLVKNHLVSDGSPSPNALHPLVSKKGEGLQGTEGSPGVLQQVTVDHSRGRENINNTVGSIFIYSPGTVILGNSASEQKGEAEEQPEGEAENPEEGQAHVTNTPQQESSEENRGPMFWDRTLRGGYVSGCVEEAEKKELCYPIPATGK